MRHLKYFGSTLATQHRKLVRTYVIMALLLVSAIALLACGPTATPVPTVPPTQTPTTVPSPTPTDQPTPTPQMVEEPAPVESVAIEVTSTDPVAADLVLVTGLPNGCYSFKGYDMTRDGDTFNVTVTNVRPDQKDLMCTMIYGMKTTRIALQGDIEVCHTYTVVVNGKAFSAPAQVPGQECDGATIREEPAPIESLAIEAEAGDPVQANLVVVSGLPNACYSFGSYNISREGDTFRVEVLNQVPDDPTQACAEIYRTVTTEIPLEGEIVICRTYTVEVNGQRYSVQAIALNVRCADTSGNEVTLKPGETVSVGDEDLQLTFLEVTEDSRCPSDVVCIQAGRATITVKGERDGEELGTVSLTLGAAESSASETLDGYTLELTRLDPYPVSTTTIQPEDYVAYVTVTKS